MSHQTELIKKYREQNGITQNELAKRLGYSSPQYISNAERNICDLPLCLAKEICKILYIPKPYFIKAYMKDAREKLKEQSGL